jgi:hypothetical protein
MEWCPMAKMTIICLAKMEVDTMVKMVLLIR